MIIERRPFNALKALLEQRVPRDEDEAKFLATARTHIREAENSIPEDHGMTAHEALMTRGGGW